MMCFCFNADIEGCISKDGYPELHHSSAQKFSKYVSYKDIKALTVALKMVYTAATKEAALDALEAFAAA